MAQRTQNQGSRARSSGRNASAPKQQAARGGGGGGLGVLVGILVLSVGAAVALGPLKDVILPSATETSLAPAEPETETSDPGGSGEVPEPPLPETPEKDVVIVVGPEPVEAPVQPPATEEPVNAKPVNLFWVRVSDEGIILMERSTRKLRTGESPLSTAVRALLGGPDAQEINQGLISLIPQGTRLLSAYIQNGTAYLSLSDHFQFNPMGAEGAKASIKQIVFTATEFTTVQAVQFLIEGKVQAFLGGDGIPVGTPIGRQSF